MASGLGIGLRGPTDAVGLIDTCNRHAHASRPAAAIRDYERDAALLIEHLIDDALNIGVIQEAVAVAVAKRTAD